MWTKTPTKPVINVESMYDARGNDNLGICYGVANKKCFRAMDVRMLGWKSWMSGSLGYTYGAGMNTEVVGGASNGIWGFSKTPGAYDIWTTAKNWPSAAQMTYMKTFFRSIDWTSLVPAPSLITNQSTLSSTKMTLAKSATGNLVVAYLPGNTNIQFNSSTFSGTLRARWFNPLTGVYSSAGTVSNSGTQPKTMTPPSSTQDWALELKP